MVPIQQHGGRTAEQHSDKGLWRTVLVSLGLHLAVVVLFMVVTIPRNYRDLTPVYTIDLTAMPVRDPQAGRPDASPRPRQEAKAAPAPAPPRPAPQPAPQTKAEPPKPAPAPKPEPKPEPKPAPKPAPEPKPAAKPAPPPPKPAPPPPPKVETAKPQPGYDNAVEAIEKLRRQREMDELKARIDALAAKDSRSGGSNAPLGMATGRGTEAGVDEQTWIQAYLKESWNLSKYQVGNRRDLQARVRIVFDAQGALLDYTIVESSRDAIFDDSVRRAVLRAGQLPFKPDRRLEITAVFNLKDLLD